MPRTLLNEFKQNLNVQWNITPRCTEHSEDHRCYCRLNIVRTRPMREWMAINGDALFKILLGIGKDEYGKLGKLPTAWANSFQRLKDCILVFSCLINIGETYGFLVQYFCDLGINDATFLDSDTRRNYNLRQKLRTVGLDDDSVSHVVKEFDLRKWQFCPATLNEEFFNGQVLPASMRLPFCERDEIMGEGGQATVRRVSIPEDFIEESFPATLDDRVVVNHKKHGKCYSFAVKAYNKAYEAEFLAERDAFIKAYKKTRGVIRYFGSFQHHDGLDRSEICHYLILELADCNLYEFFETQNPPVLPEEIVDTWKTIVKSARALEAVHNFTYQEELRSGWHGDVKPENILLVGDEWKLTDFGFFTHGDKDTHQNNLLGHSRTYAPPDNEEEKHQTFDTWSYGCVLSIAATWIVVGTSGVQNYEWHRQKAFKEAFPRSIPSAQFHDNITVYRAINGWHEALRSVMRSSDLVTSRILELVDNHLLLKDPDARLSAAELRVQLENIISDAEAFIKQPECLLQYQWVAPRLLQQARQILQDHGTTSEDDDGSSWSMALNDFTIPVEHIEDIRHEADGVRDSLAISEEYRNRLQEEAKLRVLPEITVQPSQENGPARTFRLSLTSFGSRIADAAGLNRPTSHRKQALSKRISKIDGEDTLRPNTGASERSHELRAPSPLREGIYSERLPASHLSSRTEDWAVEQGMLRTGTWTEKLPERPLDGKMRMRSDTVATSAARSFEHSRFNAELRRKPPQPLQILQTKTTNAPKPQVSRNPIPSGLDQEPDESQLEPRPPITPRNPARNSRKNMADDIIHFHDRTVAGPSGLSPRGIAVLDNDGKSSTSNSVRQDQASARSYKDSVSISDSSSILTLARSRSPDAPNRIKNLLTQHPDLDLTAKTDDEGRTPIMLAASRLALANIFVLRADSGLHVKDREDKTVLHHLIIARTKTSSKDLDKHLSTVLDGFLTAGGAELARARDNDGHTALYYACGSAKADMVDAVMALIEAEKQGQAIPNRAMRLEVLQRAIDIAPEEVLRALEQYAEPEDWNVVDTSNTTPSGRAYLKRRMKHGTQDRQSRWTGKSFFKPGG